MIEHNPLSNRHALFAGDLLVGTNDLFAQFKQQCWQAVLRNHSNPETLGAADLWEIVQQVRMDLREPHWKLLIASSVQQSGIQEPFYVDTPTLRCSRPNGHTQLQAAKAYGTHRDTWYGYPAGIVNIWVPLMGHTQGNGMEVFETYFQTPVRNNSEKFRLTEWSNNTNVFPECLENIDGQSGTLLYHSNGEYYLFSGQHLHRGQPNLSNTTRWSVDFRLYFQDSGPALCDCYSPDQFKFPDNTLFLP